MSVVGFDFGNEFCYVAIARQGGIEVVSNEYTYRQTPSVVALSPKKRFLGEAGKTQVATNFKNSVFSFKNLLGRRYKDPKVQEELKRSFYKTVELPDGQIGIMLEYQGETKAYTPQQVCGMLFTQLKGTAESNLNMKVTDCVLSVPSYFADAQRRALLEAAQIAGLNVLRLFNETTATALAYGIYKTDLPSEPEKPRNVIFVDAGESSLQVSAVAFYKNKLTVLAQASDSQLGGRSFDFRLLDHFAQHFKQQYKIDVYSNPKALLRLRTECEKLKKLMSANTSEIPISIECLMDDKDVRGKMSRAEFEEISKDILERIAVPCRKVLEDSKLQPDDIYSVEVVGGSSRVPSIKQIVTQVFNKDVSLTLNQDEAVARGCALMCAIISPVFRVREFQVNDVNPYAINLSWKMADGSDTSAEVFSEHNAIPSTKLMTFSRSDALEIVASYANPEKLPGGESHIGKFRIEGIHPDKNGQPAKIKVKVRVNPSGIFSVEGAYRVDEVDVAAAAATPAAASAQPAATDANCPAPMDTDQADADAASQQQQQSQQQNPDAMETDEKPSSSKKKITKTPLNVLSFIECSLSHEKLLQAIETENQLIINDRVEREREDARNAVEEYVYDMRDKLSDRYNEYTTDEVKKVLQSELESTESWLYSEGEEQPKKVYVKKLEELKKLSDPFVKRYLDGLERPKAEEAFRTSIVKFRKVVDLYSTGDERYAHIAPEEIAKVADTLNAKEKWLNEKIAAQAKHPLSQDPILSSQNILAEKDAFEALCNPIVNKPKPKPKPADVPPVPKEDNAAPNASTAPEGDAAKPATNSSEDAVPMDLDK